MKKMDFTTDQEVIAIFGRRGSGKTTKSIELLEAAHRKRIIVYDIKAEYPFKKLYGRAEFARFMKTNWFKDFAVSYVPNAKEKPEHIRELSNLCYGIAQEQHQNFTEHKARNLTLLVEEMSICAPNQRYKEGMGGFEYAVNLSRSWGVEIIGVSQRPAQVNTDYRGNASQTYFYALADDLDITAAKQKLGKNSELLKELPRHAYFLVDATGKVISGKNKAKFK
ncbi:MAG: hypothetical protein ACRBDL_03435 [Alphaproteobacteria bacterium]